MSDEQRRLDLLAELGSVRAVAKRLGMDNSALLRWYRNRGIDTSGGKAPRSGAGGSTRGAEPAGASINSDIATLISRANPRGTGTLEPDELMRDHGLDPADWDFTATLNVWDALTGEGSVTTLAQLKLACKRKPRIELILPQHDPLWTPPKPRARRKTRGPELHVLFSDTHNPHIDAGLEDCATQFLAKNTPASWSHLGDGVNLAKPSRHRDTPEHSDEPSECFISLRKTLAMWANASPDSARRYKPGNHCHRVRNAVIEAIPSLRELVDEYMSFSILADLDNLGIDYIEPHGEYHEAKFELVPGLVLQHGTKAGKHGGALKAQDRRESSVAQGHDHKQSLTSVVRYSSDGVARQHWAISVGAMCLRNLGYVDDPDTAQGFATITVWPDGRWHPELAIYDENTGVLTWRDQRFTV